MSGHLCCTTTTLVHVAQMCMDPKPSAACLPYRVVASDDVLKSLMPRSAVQTSSPALIGPPPAAIMTVPVYSAVESSRA